MLRPMRHSPARNLDFSEAFPQALKSRDPNSQVYRCVACSPGPLNTKNRHLAMSSCSRSRPRQTGESSSCEPNAPLRHFPTPTSLPYLSANRPNRSVELALRLPSRPLGEWTSLGVE